MSGKNLEFLERLKECLAKKEVVYEAGKRGELKKFANDSKINYTTLHKCFLEPGYILPWKDLIKLKVIFNKSIDWFITGEEIEINQCCVNCTPEEKELGCRAVAVLRSDTIYARELKDAINTFYSFVKADKQARADIEELKEMIKQQDKRLNDLQNELNNYKKTHEPGPKSDTQEVPAGGIGSNGKAG